MLIEPAEKVPEPETVVILMRSITPENDFVPDALTTELAPPAFVTTCATQVFEPTKAMINKPELGEPAFDVTEYPDVMLLVVTIVPLFTVIDD